MPKLIIDCDPGHDDAFALILAHRHADVVGITTVTGNAPLEATTRNALAITALLDVDTPVHAGAAAPLVGEPKHAPHVHGESGLGGVDLPQHARSIASEEAVQFLIDQAADDVWLVAIGPLTNVALAIRRDPTLLSRYAGLSVMGGSAGVGNVTSVAEFNIWADPEAAGEVFAAGGRIVMCGLNLTHQFLTDDALAAEIVARGSPQAIFAGQILAYLHERMEELIGERRSAMHDPCAVLAVTHPDLIRAEPRAVGVELAGTLTRGMTVVDERTSRRRDPANVEVAYEIDAAAARRLVLASID